jgi:hypothetical protein
MLNYEFKHFTIHQDDNGLRQIPDVQQHAQNLLTLFTT